MKKKLLPLLISMLVFCLSVQQASAKIWRVNNTSNYNGTTLWGDNLGGTSSNPVFAELDDANKSNLVSVNGIDTLHIEGTNINYKGVNFGKAVIVIGPGYFLNENPNVSNTVMEAAVNYIYFGDGSEGSQLMGVHIYGNLGIDIQVNNIVVKRCNVDYSIGVNSKISDIFILQNYFSNAPNSNNSAIVVSNLGFPSNFIFDNNISKKTLLLSNGSTVYNAEECNNNVFDCPAISGKPSIQMNASSFKNNILKTPAASVAINSGVEGTNVSHNISSSSVNQFGTANNNIVITNMASLFVDPTGNTTDGRYQLKPGSAAGADGTERGAFGGLAVSNHYTLSGLAPIPVVYQVTTSGVGNASINVTIQARTIK